MHLATNILRNSIHTQTAAAAKRWLYLSSTALRTQRQTQTHRTCIPSPSIALCLSSSVFPRAFSSTTPYSSSGSSSNPVPVPPDDEENESHLSTLFKAATIHYPDDDAEMRSLIAEAQNKNRLAVIDWSASWCPPCRAIAPLYERLSKQPENKHVTFIKADIEDLPDASYEAGVESVPTFHFIKNNKLVAAFSGADAEKLQQLIEEHR